ncbi:MAG: hypothetical protein ACHQVS_01980 [Candidatus Babeliales bacterium]
MKPINFINPIPPATHRALTRFMRYTLLATSVFLIIIASITVHQLQRLYSIKQHVTTLRTHCARFNKALKHQQELTVQEQELHNKLTTITMLRTKQVSPHTCIQALHAHIPLTASLHTITLHAPTITCSMQCKDPRTAHHYTQALLKTGICTATRITEMRSQAHAYQATLELTC